MAYTLGFERCPRVLDVVAAAFAVTACLTGGSTSAASSYSVAEIPAWVLNPTSPSGIAATGCTSYSGNIGVDRRVAVASARSELAQKLEVRVKTVDQVYQSKTENQSLNVSFASHSKQVTEQTLRNTSPSKVEVIQMDGKQQLCALLELRKEETKMLFRNVVKAAPVSLSLQEEDELFEVFSQ